MKILSRTIRKARGRRCARIRYQDENGKHELLRTCDSRPEARTKLAQLETELLEKGPAQLVAGKVTFRQLVDYAAGSGRVGRIRSICVYNTPGLQCQASPNAYRYSRSQPGGSLIEESSGGKTIKLSILRI